MKRQIEVRVVIGDVDVGVLAGRRPVDGLPLHELGDAGRVAPDGIVQQAVDGRGGRGPARPHRHPPREHTGVSGRRGRGESRDPAGRAGAGRGPPRGALRRESAGGASDGRRRDGAGPARGPPPARVRPLTRLRRGCPLRPRDGRGRPLGARQAGEPLRHLGHDPILEGEQLVGVAVDLGDLPGRSRLDVDDARDYPQPLGRPLKPAGHQPGHAGVPRFGAHAIRAAPRAGARCAGAARPTVDDRQPARPLHAGNDRLRDPGPQPVVAGPTRDVREGRDGNHRPGIGGKPQRRLAAPTRLGGRASSRRQHPHDENRLDGATRMRLPRKQCLIPPASGPTEPPPVLPRTSYRSARPIATRLARPVRSRQPVPPPRPACPARPQPAACLTDRRRRSPATQRQTSRARAHPQSGRLFIIQLRAQIPAAMGSHGQRTPPPGKVPAHDGITARGGIPRRPESGAGGRTPPIRRRCRHLSTTRAARAAGCPPDKGVERHGRQDARLTKA